MNEQRKIWLGLGAALIVTSTVTQAVDTTHNHSSHQAMQVAAYSGGEGEGEGVSAPVDLGKDDAAYLAHLGLVRGHLWVGVQLYNAGHKGMALTHMKHPKDELYADLEPAFEARNEAGFADVLSALAAAVEAGEPAKRINELHAQLEQGVTAVENLEGKGLKTVLLSVERLVRTAAEEYALGVKDGEIINTHEYQDSYGFVETAKARLNALTAAQRQQGLEVLEEVSQQLQALSHLWPELVPEGSLDSEASDLYVAAARIQLATLELE